jgi:hypothetical protein
LGRFQKRLVLVFCGRSNLSAEAFHQLRLLLRNRAELVVAGERSDVEISKILQCLDLGLATTPRQNIQKSGSVAAMLEHGLHVLVTRDDWKLRSADSMLETACRRLLSPEQFLSLSSLPGRDLPPLPERSLKNVARQLASTLISQPPVELAMVASPVSVALCKSI